MTTSPARFPRPTLTEAQHRVLTLLVCRTRPRSTREVAGLCDWTWDAAQTVLQRLDNHGLVHRVRNPRRERRYRITPSGRTHLAALTLMAATLKPLTDAGLPRPQAEVLHVLLSTDQPLVASGVAWRCELGSDTVRVALRELRRRGLADGRPLHNDFGTPAVGWTATEQARALTTPAIPSDEPLESR